MTAAAILLALAALGGATLLILRIKRRANPPLALAFAHGAVAAAGLLTLAVTVLGSGERGVALWALVAFCVAAAGGLTMVFGFHMRGRLIPVPLALLHGLLAVTGYVTLLVAMCR